MFVSDRRWPQLGWPERGPWLYTLDCPAQSTQRWHVERVAENANRNSSVIRRMNVEPGEYRDG